MIHDSNPTQILIWGWTLGFFLLLSYHICIGFGLLAPQSMPHAYEAWAPLLPGFEWLTLQGFLAGALGSFLYGWRIALFVVPLHALIGRKVAGANHA